MERNISKVLEGQGNAADLVGMNFLLVLKLVGKDDCMSFLDKLLSKTKQNEAKQKLFLNAFDTLLKIAFWG